MDRLGDRVPVGVRPDRAEHGVPHDHRRRHRVQDDDRLAALAAPPTASMACAVVSVNSSMLARVPGPAEREAMDATISAYGTGGHPGNRVHHRDGRLAAAGDHVDVRRPGVHVGVHRGADERADGRRGQVDRDDPGVGIPGGVGQVGLGRGGLEDQVGQSSCSSSQSTPPALASTPSVAGPGQAVGRRVDADHVAHVDELAALQLDEQVGADVAGADDGGGRLRPPVGHWRARVAMVRGHWMPPVLPDGRPGRVRKRCAPRIDARRPAVVPPSGRIEWQLLGLLHCAPERPSSTHAYR